jgi:hypothetical protein
MATSAFRKSLYQQHGPRAIGVLQGLIKNNFDLPNLGTGFSIEDHGNHYIIRKDDNELRVPLFAASEVFRALNFIQENQGS